MCPISITFAILKLRISPEVLQTGGVAVDFAVLNVDDKVTERGVGGACTLRPIAVTPTLIYKPRP